MGGDEKVPWLALLLFHEEDALDEVKKLNLKEAINAPEFQFSLRFPPEYQERDENISLIQIGDDILDEIIPTQEELKLLAHVRQVNESSDSESKNTELAVIIGNRLPQPGRNIVHLVSLENYFHSKSQNKFQDFVSLKSWKFHCKEGNSEDRFRKLLINLNSDSANSNTLRQPQQNANDDAEKYLSQGYVPAIHHLRNGQKTISWYRGPLLPGHNKATLPPEIFPILNPDRLLRYLTEIDMFDVSYATAYQLGQLLALQDPYFSVSLYNWKRKQRRSQCTVKSEILEMIFDERATSSSKDITLPEEIKKWFDRVWWLENIPFNYLVSDPSMLLEESIRFFWVDRQWLECSSTFPAIKN